MRWYVLCRRWKPMIRRRNLWRAVRISAKRSLPRVHVTHPYSRVSITSALKRAQLQRERGSLHIVQFPLESTVAYAHGSRTRRLSAGIISALASIRSPRYTNCVVCLYVWPAASMTSGEVQSAWSRVRSSMVSVFFSDTVRPAASKTVTMTIIILARPFADLDTISCIIGVQHAPNCPPCTWYRVRAYPRRVLLKVLEVNQTPHNAWVLTEAYYHGVSQQRRY